jgi:hypothetical protein
MKSGRIRAIGITSTFFMAKGLTFDSVLLPRLTAKAYYINRERMKRMMFVGIARATQWVYLSTVKGTEFDEMAVLKEAAAQGHLTMQSGGKVLKPDGGDGGSGKKGPENEYSVL